MASKKVIGLNVSMFITTISASILSAIAANKNHNDDHPHAAAGFSVLSTLTFLMSLFLIVCLIKNKTISEMLSTVYQQGIKGLFCCCKTDTTNDGALYEPLITRVNRQM